MRITFCLVAAMALSPLRALAETPAQGYLRGRTSLAASLSLGASSTWSDASGRSNSGVIVGLGVIGRRTFDGWVLEGDVTTTFGHSQAHDALQSQSGLHVYVEGHGAFGRAFAVGDRVLIIPEVFAGVAMQHEQRDLATGEQRNFGAVLELGARATVTVLVSDHVFLEPYVALTHSSVLNFDTPNDSLALRVGVGQRFGFYF